MALHDHIRHAAHWRPSLRQIPCTTVGSLETRLEGCLCFEQSLLACLPLPCYLRVLRHKTVTRVLSRSKYSVQADRELTRSGPQRAISFGSVIRRESSSTWVVAPSRDLVRRKRS